MIPFQKDEIKQLFYFCNTIDSHSLIADTQFLWSSPDHLNHLFPVHMDRFRYGYVSLTMSRTSAMLIAEERVCEVEPFRFVLGGVCISML